MNFWSARWRRKFRTGICAELGTDDSKGIRADLLGRTSQSLLSQCLDALQKDLQRVSIFNLV
jgi:hypothetical protein